MKTQLRVGNFIGSDLKADPQNFFTVLEVGDTMKVCDGAYSLKDIDERRMLTNFIDVSNFEGIPLSEDWLIKFGFTKEKQFWSFEGFKVWESETNGKTHFYHINSEIIIYFETVHKLQNVYFSITDEELLMK